MGHDPNYQNPYPQHPQQPYPHYVQQPAPQPVIVNVSQSVVQGYWGPTGPSPGTAALLEFLGGLFCGTFGIGHIYGGHVILGLLILIGSWFIVACLVGLGAVTFGIGLFAIPVYWIAMLIFSPLIAYSMAGR